MRLQVSPLLGRQGREEAIADGRALLGGMGHSALLRVMRREHWPLSVAYGLGPLRAMSLRWGLAGAFSIGGHYFP